MYAEGFRGADHLRRIVEEVQARSMARLPFEGILACSFMHSLERSITMQTELLKIAGMSCGGCTRAY